MGETPNLAARLQNLAEPDSVVIDANTHTLTSGIFEYEELGMVELKGFVEPVRAWRVQGESTIESRFEALHSATALTPLVGREQEIELMVERWMQAKSGAGQVILLSGEPGIKLRRSLPSWSGCGTSATSACATPARRTTRTARCIRRLCNSNAPQFRAWRYTRDKVSQNRGTARADVVADCGSAARRGVATHSRWRSVLTERARSASQEGGDVRAVAPPARRSRAEPAGTLGLRGRPLDRPQLTPVPRSRGQSGGRAACTVINYISARVSVAMDRAVTHYDARPQPPRPAPGCDARAVGRGRQRASPVHSGRDHQAQRRCATFHRGIDEAVVEAEASRESGEDASTTTSRSALAVPATLHASLMARLDRTRARSQEDGANRSGNWP